MPTASRHRTWLPCVCSSKRATSPQSQRVAPRAAAVGRPGVRSNVERNDVEDAERQLQEPGSATNPSLESTALLTDSVGSSLEAAPGDGGLLQMSGDRLCIRTMDVTYVDADGTTQHVSRTGHNCSVFLPPHAHDIEASFSVLGGGAVCKVDRDHPERPWLRDEQGRIPEKFCYATVPQHVQFFVCGPSLHSWVTHVDMRQRTDNLIELVSLDFHCVRTMYVDYIDPRGGKQSWSHSGYNPKFHIPALARDVEVTFSVVGGRDVYKVDRRLPGTPWVEDANGERPREKFFFASPPACVQFEARGYSLNCYISRVREQQVSSDRLAPDNICGRFQVPRSESIDLFSEMINNVPAVGGLMDLSSHSDFLLPAEVVLFEPSQNEIFSTKGARQIFANTPLLDTEITALGELHQHLAKIGVGGSQGVFPRYMEVHALRLLQTAKFNVSKAATLMDFMAKERVTRLPMAESEVLSDLKAGFMYWHGRDRWCRPCMVIRLERMGGLVKDKEAGMRVVIFVLEYALRFAMVPGRVENWVVLLDLSNALSILSPWEISGFISTAAALGKTLEQVYCGRMVWMKIVNLPGGDFLRRAINSAIPAEKRAKVSFSRDIGAELKDLFEPNQLESRFGGSAPDVVPGEAYPFRFFPNCRGALSDRALHHEEAGSGVVEPEDFSLHEATNLDFHEGVLWDTSSEEARERWLPKAKASSLPPMSTEALSRMLGGAQVAPCSDAMRWLSLVNPGMALSRASSRCLLTRAGSRDLDDEQSQEQVKSPAVRSIQRGDDFFSEDARSIMVEV